MGYSGFIEVLGLMFWAYELVANMRAGKKLESDSSVGLSGLAFDVSGFTHQGPTLKFDVFSDRRIIPSKE